jgi:hypothetical protein
MKGHFIWVGCDDMQFGKFTDVWKKHVATTLKVEAAHGKILIQGRVDWVG